VLAGGYPLQAYIIFFYREDGKNLTEIRKLVRALWNQA